MFYSGNRWEVGLFEAQPDPIGELLAAGFLASIPPDWEPIAESDLPGEGGCLLQLEHLLATGDADAPVMVWTARIDVGTSLPSAFREETRGRTENGLP